MKHKIDTDRIKKSVVSEFAMFDYGECTESGMLEFIVNEVLIQQMEAINKFNKSTYKYRQEFLLGLHGDEE